MRWIKTFVIMLIFLIAVVVLGSVTPLDKEEATNIVEETKKILPEEPSVIAIFINNLRITLLMVVPVLGLVIGVYTIYSTGLVLSATGVTTGLPGGLLLLITALLPFFWLEFVAYAASLTQSIYLTLTFWRRKIRGELKRLIYVITISTALLLFGAIIEMLFIHILT